jgi:hypothetical protein
MAFEKTVMGPMAGIPQPSGAPPAGSPPADLGAAHDLGRAATIEGPAPQFTPPAAAPASAATPSALGTPAARPSAPAGHGGSSGSFAGAAAYDAEDAPAGLPKANSNKALTIGCAAVLAIGLVLAGVLYFLAKDKLSGGDEAATQAWRGTLSQALSQVSALCQSDCQTAANYFHPSVQASLVGQAKALTAARLQKLVDPAQATASMLNGTDDESVATQLSLDPQLCVRIVAGSAKAIGCSVPNPGGPADMRIVQLAGVDTL